MAATVVNQDASEPIHVGFSDLKQGEAFFWNYEHKLFSISAHQGLREYMEDRMYCLCDPEHKFSIFSIFDGHGGEFVSDFLEKNFTDRIRQRLLDTNLTKSEAIKEAVTDEIHKFDEDMSKVNPEKSKMAGSTLTSAIVHNNKIYVIQIGDSKAVACDKDGKAVCLTTEHKPSEPSERERIENAGGHIETIGVDRVEGVLAVSRAVGDAAFKENEVVTVHPDIVEVDLVQNAYQYIILGSDGLFDVITATEAVDFANNFLKENGLTQFSKLAHALCKEAFKRKSQDNISAIVVKLVF